MPAYGVNSIKTKRGKQTSISITSIHVNSWSSENPVDTFWITITFLRGKRITPSMHVLFAHVPYFLHTHKSIKVFTGQKVEKNNENQTT